MAEADSGRRSDKKLGLGHGHPRARTGGGHGIGPRRHPNNRTMRGKPMQGRWILVVAGVLGAIGVGIGAFAAHGLEKMLAGQGLQPEEIAERVAQCEVAVRYHMLHVLALMSLGVWVGQPGFIGQKSPQVAAVLFLAGIALFSGGLYSMVFWGRMGHWAIVPSGGMCFILGWLAIVTAACRAR
ncbi:MAG: DUF423 domain-containing protein [Planctomycetota bacterium]|nr:MAG: DUF423 domain-containing protein [Planctomycetota bacterium]